MDLGALDASEASGNQGIEWLRGSGEMVQRLRALDAASPLGAPSGWPPELRTVVRMMLASPRPQCLWWGDEAIQLYNDAFADLLGGRHPAALARPGAEAWPEAWQALAPCLRQALARGEGASEPAARLRLAHRGHPEDVWLSWSCEPVFAAGDRPVGALCSFSDETARVLGEQQLAALHALTTDMGRAGDAAQACALASESLERRGALLPFALLYLLDAEAGRAALAGCSGLVPGARDTPASLSLGDARWRLQRVLARRPSWQLLGLRRRTLRTQGRDGAPRPNHAVQLALTPPGEHEPAAVLILGLDPCRPFDAAYQQFIADLAERLAAGIGQARARGAQKQQIEALQRRGSERSAQLARIGRELRAPLTLVLGPLEALAELPAPALAAPVRADVAMARRNGLRLLKLVDGLLDSAQVEAGVVAARPEPLDLAALTREIASEFSGAARRRQLAFDVECEPLAQPAWVDRAMWEKIVLHLLSNALRFTERGGVQLRLRADGEHVELRISDSGAGIAAAPLAELLERIRSGAAAPQGDGSGLGLALVQKLVTLHGGTLSAKSAEGQGSTFIVRLPLAQPASPASAAASAPAAAPQLRQAFIEHVAGPLPETAVEDGEAPAGGSATILFVDGDADMRRFARRLLGGYRLLAVEDGEQALAVLRQEAVDLVLADAAAPRLDGTRLLAALRADPATAMTPVILLSAQGGEDARLDGIRSGADDYLAKPFSGRELQARVEAQLASARLRELRTQRERALRAEAEILVELVHEIGGELEIERLVQKITEAGVRLTGAGFGAFFYDTVDERGVARQHCAAAGTPAGVFSALPLPRSAPLLAPIFAGQGVVRSGDITAHPDFARSFQREARSGEVQLRSYLGVPVKGRWGLVLGALFFGHPQADVFDERTERLATGIAVQAAVALDNARAYRDATQAIERSIRSESAYRNSERRYRQLINAMPIAVYTCDADGVMTLCNRAAVTLWGREPSIGRDRWCGSHEMYSAETGAPLAPEESPMAVALREGRAIFGAELLLGRPDGSQRHVLVYPRPLYDEEGAVSGAINIFVDVTEQKQREQALQRSEQLYRAIGESIDFGVWICDAQGRNLYASDSLLQLVGMTQEQFSETGWMEVLHPDDREPTRRAWADCVRRGANWDREHRFRGRDGRWHPVLARGVAVRDENGEVTGWAGINLDIERLKRVEDELRESDQRKNEFLAILAHELRNPLAPIINGLEVLRRGGGDPALAAQAQTLMERQARNMVRLVDDLLDLSRITRGLVELRRARLDVRQALRSAIDAARPMIAAAGHELQLEIAETPAEVQADATRLEQIFTNLLNNAARYTPRGGWIRVVLAVEGAEIVVSVADNGIGIPEQMQRRIFEMFAQGDRSLERSTGGLGIGLTLVQRLVAMHGGAIDVHSEGPNHGAVFTVRLPRAATGSVEPEPVVAPVAATPPAEVRRILVVDDHADAAESMALMLSMRGDEVRVARNGLEAVEQAASFRPQIVLMDIGMPVLNGYEACRRIRATEAGRQMTIVAMTGWGQHEDKQRSREAGFDQHWVKPVAAELIDGLMASLGGARPRAERA